MDVILTLLGYTEAPHKESPIHEVHDQFLRYFVLFCSLYVKNFKPAEDDVSAVTSR